MNIARFIGFWLLLAGCAIQSAPDGGEKDITPPEIIMCSPPNKSIQFNATEIIITFDEYVQLKNFSGQFFSSPPLKKRIEQRLKGKKLHLYLDEELLPNTTYTFSFGNAIEDLTENNTQANFKYVFSTGDVLDSLHVSGTVVDAFTGNAEEGAVAMLFPAHLPDSILVKSRPAFYGITNKLGAFTIENLAQDTFKLVVIKDENLNLTFDTATEKSGFYPNEIIAGEPLSQPIRLFEPKRQPLLLDAVQKGYGKILFAFSVNTTGTQVNIIDAPEIVDDSIPNENFFEQQGSDSLYFWYNPALYPKDQRFLFVNVSNSSVHRDSVRVLVSNAKLPTFNLALKNSSKLSPIDSFLIESATPIRALNPSLFAVYEDSLPVAFDLRQIKPRQIYLDFDKKQGTTYTLQIMPEAATDLFGRVNDTIAIKTRIATEEEKAVVKFRIMAVDTMPKLFELLRGKQTIKRIAFTDSVVLDLRYIEPRTYGIRIIWDENANGQWDGGNFSDRKQPEAVLYYPNPIELRANWELEIEWVIPETE
jgi:hypothetical protein